MEVFDRVSRFVTALTRTEPVAASNSTADRIAAAMQGSDNPGDQQALTMPQISPISDAVNAKPYTSQGTATAICRPTVGQGGFVR